MNEKAYKAISKGIKSFKTMKYCGPSDDPDLQTFVVIAMNDVVKQLRYCSKYIIDQELKTELINLSDDIQNIYDVHNVRGDLLPIIDSLEEYLEEQLSVPERAEITLDPLKRVSVIESIALALQERMSTSDINTLLYGYRLTFNAEKIAQSKRTYVKEILVKANDTIILQIARDLKLINEDESIITAELNRIDHEYVKEQIAKCQNKIECGDYDGAITNARSLIESVCLHIIEESAATCEAEGNLNKIYRQVYKQLSMDPQNYNDHESLKQICAGFISVVNGLASIRNEMGDAHGKKNIALKPTLRHAMLATNAAKTISDYLLMSFLKE